MPDDVSSMNDLAPPVLTNNWITYSPFMTGHPRYLPPEADTTRPFGPGIGPALPPTSSQDDTGIGTKPTHIPGLKPPEMDSYYVEPGSLESAADSILVKANTAVDTYTDLRNYITLNKSWIFSAADPSKVMPNETSATIDQICNPQCKPAPPQWQGEVNAPGGDPHPEWTHDFSVASDMLLLAVADSIFMAGQFLDMVNNAGQFYTRADKHSVMPTMGFQSGSTGA